MQFPAVLKIRVLESGSGKPVAKLALKVTLFAPPKNNYTIPIVTDIAGEAHLTAAHVRRSIMDDWAAFSMDYISPLEECSVDVEVKVCTTEDVGRSIQAMKCFVLNLQCQMI